MPRFMAVHSAPFTEADVMGAARDMPRQLPAGVSWKQTYCGFGDNKFFCEWEAPNKEVIEQVFKAADMPFDVIYPVRLLDVEKRELEA